MSTTSLNHYIGRLQSAKSTRLAAISLAFGAALAGAAQMAGAACIIAPGSMRSTESCLFAKQLHDSASIRVQYTNKLIEVISGAVAPVNVKSGRIGQITGTQKIDALSADCLDCHDGVSALQVTAVVKNSPFNGASWAPPGRNQMMNGMDHPIGMDYKRYVTASREYKPLSGSSSEKMVFVDGKVGCLTCHDPLNAEKGHLVFSDSHSALCLTCHND